MCVEGWPNYDQTSYYPTEKRLCLTWAMSYITYRCGDMRLDINIYVPVHHSTVGVAIIIL